MKNIASIAVDSAEQAVASLISSYPHAIDLPPARRWHYHQGVFLLSVLRLEELTGNEDFYRYARGYAEELISPDGTLHLADDELDAMQAGNILFPIIEREDDPRYRKALDYIISLLDGFGTTDQGGFWHKDKYPHQQWLDGLYMAGPVTVRYAQLAGRSELADVICAQANLIYNGSLDRKSGLLRHGFDRSGKAPWAEDESGRAPEVWGRALGWFPAALLDILDYLPPGHRDAEGLRGMFASLIRAILAHQDPESRLWFQIVDRGGDPDNWIESSCSSLFIYSLAKGIRTGILGEELKPRLEAAYLGLLTRTGEGAAGFEVRDICIGTSIGTREYYYSRPVSINDLHGVGAFVLASVETARTLA
jgi:unsaturated rhamnogalacturonyl hydrolase